MTGLRPVTLRPATTALILFFVATVGVFGVIAPRFATATNAENLMWDFRPRPSLPWDRRFRFWCAASISHRRHLGVVGMVVFDLAQILHAPGYLLIPAAIAVGTLAGVVNGVLIVFLRLQPFIATLARSPPTAASSTRSPAASSCPGSPPRRSPTDGSLASRAISTSAAG